MKGPPWLWLRLGLVAFVLAWILGPHALRDSVPILLVFLLGLGLEIQFLVSALRGGGPSRTPDRGPQEVDREWYGFDGLGTENEDEDGEADWFPAPPRAHPLRTFGIGIAVIAGL